MKELPLYVGIDISSDRLDVALRPGSEAWQVSYNAQGVADLVGRLCELTPHLVVLEATGGMELALIGELASADLPIAVVNRLKWTQSFGQESRLVKLESSTPIHCQAGTSSGVRLTSDWCTWFLPSSNAWAGVL